ncbi:hypothetical protein [Paraburkholderia sp. J10-1]|uniref:hypothetical protein n=1 Tax=Paraburkholderia sp. J10-1 TaxID=2805430 RepID=UPI002AB6AE0C|nr:hypothetical protein [Paraburkholderia sp. J10-1]
MRSSKTESLAYFVIAFILLLVIGLTVRDGGGQPHFLADINHVLDGTHDMSDPGSFALGAKDIYLHGWFTAVNMWLIHLWPPGFMLLEGAILKVFGPETPVVLILQILASACLAAMMLLQRMLLKPMIGALPASILPLSILLLPVARQFLLEPLGVVLGETFSVSLFISSVTLVVLALQRRQVRWAIVGGICLALAAYFRSQFELLVLAYTALAIPLAAWLVIGLRGTRSDAQRTARRFMLRAVIAFVITAQLLMLPWRIHNKIDAGSFRWVQTMDVVASNSLSTNQYLLEKNGGFVIEGGGDLSCKFEPSYCGKTDTHFFFSAFVRHFPEWEKVKISLAPKYWFSSLKNTGILRFPATKLDIVWNAILLIFTVAIVPLQIAIRRHSWSPLLLWINLSFFSPFFVVFSLVAFEARYFYLVKIFGFSMCMLLACLTWTLQTSQRRGEIGVFSAK